MASLPPPEYSDGRQFEWDKKYFTPITDIQLLERMMKSFSWVAADFFLKRDASKEKVQGVLKALPENYQFYTQKYELPAVYQKNFMEVVIVGHPR
jgi:hypothetical protein